MHLSHIPKLNSVLTPYNTAPPASQSTMDRELDNANPTIFAPTASGSKRQQSAKSLLWSDEADKYTLSDEGGSSEDEEREEIDAEEVFGMCAPHPI